MSTPNRLDKVRRKVEMAQATVRAALSDLSSAQRALNDAIEELRLAVADIERAPG